MDYVKPIDVASAMVNAGRTKLALPATDLIIRGGLAGGILAAATSLAITGTVQTGQPLVGALVFPVGLILMVLLGLDLVTGAFGLLLSRWIENDADTKTMLATGGAPYPLAISSAAAPNANLSIALTNFGATAPAGVAAKIVAIAEAKTTGYAVLGFAGLVTVFVKAILCNWMVCLAIVAAMTTSSTIGKIACVQHAGLHLLRAGLRAFGGEHVHRPDRHVDGRQGHRRGLVAVDQIPVTLGNLVGGFVSPASRSISPTDPAWRRPHL